MALLNSEVVWCSISHGHKIGLWNHWNVALCLRHHPTDFQSTTKYTPIPYHVYYGYWFVLWYLRPSQWSWPQDRFVKSLKCRIMPQTSSHGFSKYHQIYTNSLSCLLYWFVLWYLRPSQWRGDREMKNLVLDHLNHTEAQTDRNTDEHNEDIGRQ